jgi:hypothetical protein
MLCSGQTALSRSGSSLVGRSQPPWIVHHQMYPNLVLRTQTLLDVTSARTLRTTASSSAQTFVATGLRTMESIQLSVPSLSRMLRLGNLVFSRSQTTQVISLRAIGRPTSSKSSVMEQLHHPVPLQAPLQAPLQQLHLLPIHLYQTQYLRLHRQVVDPHQARHLRPHHQITDPHLSRRRPRLQHQESLQAPL